MQIIRFSLLLVMLSGLTSLAWSAPPQPSKCPSTAAIQEVGLMAAIKRSDGYYAGAINKFDTPDPWVFGMGPIDAKSSNEALQKGKAALSSLIGVDTPTYHEENKIWLCAYHTDAGYMAIAGTPVPRYSLSDAIPTVISSK